MRLRLGNELGHQTDVIFDVDTGRGVLQVIDPVAAAEVLRLRADLDYMIRAAPAAARSQGIE